jgi:metallo-beta-lactamase class B
MLRSSITLGFVVVFTATAVRSVWATPAAPAVPREAAPPANAPAPDPRAPISCEACDAWNAPHAPFLLFGNTYYVGVTGLSAVLITSPQGHVLIEGGLPQSAAHVAASVRALGFRLSDVRYLLATHEHYDHAGALAALQADTGAVVVGGEPAVRALRLGIPLPEDPQYESGRQKPFAPVTKTRAVKDGEVLRVGTLEVTAHRTPGHTPGGTSWTWRACEQARCQNVVFADSLNPVSDDSFRFTAQPGLVEAFIAGLDTLAALPCDVLVTGHPGFSGLFEKLAARDRGDKDAFVDPEACRALAKSLRQKLDQRVARERQSASSK